MYDQQEAQARSQALGQRNRLVGDPPKPIPRLDGPAVHLEEMTKGLADYTTRLSCIADRFLGAVPEAVEKDGGQVRPACVTSRYESIADVYAQLLRKLGGVVDRLESI